MMYRLFIPFMYMFHSRLKNTSETVQWFLTDIVPAFFICWYIASPHMGSLSVLAIFVLGILATYSVYEMGYIGNDVFTTSKEAMSPDRLSVEETAFCRSHYVGLIGVRIVVFSLAVGLIYLLAQSLGVTISLVSFLVAMVLLRLIFLAHNTLRGRMTVFTFFGLAVFKYSSVLLLFQPFPANLLPFLIGVTLFPLPRTLGVSNRPKYELPFMKTFVGDFYVFRVRYYILFFVLSLVAYGVWRHELLLLMVLLHGFYLLLRTGALLALKKNLYRRKGPLKIRINQ
jgi:hypothetical protein